jgi:hypothetical protein
MPLPLEVWLDTELRVMHARPDCAGAKIPYKYGYLKRETVRTAEQARILDKSFRACEACRKYLASRRSPPSKNYRYRPRGTE